MSKIKKLQEMVRMLPQSLRAGHIAGNSTVKQFTGNYKGNHLSRGYAIWDSMNIVFAGTFEECEKEIQEAISVQEENFL